MEEFHPKVEKFPQEENQIEKPKIKEGVDFVFEQNPELAKIGTQEQYSEYLDAVFPESKVKDIVYHGSNNKDIDKFKTSRGSYGTGVYFQTEHGKYHTGTFGENIFSVVIDTKNPLTFYADFKGQDGTLSKLWLELREEHAKNRTLESLADDFNHRIQNSGYDSLKIQLTDVTSFAKKDTFYYLVYKPEQINILGSNQDIVNFKKFTEHQT